MRFLSVLAILMCWSALASREDNACLTTQGAPSLELADSLRPFITDSFVDNCPDRRPYTDQFPNAKTTAELQTQIEEKFKELGLEVKWSRSQSIFRWLRNTSFNRRLGSGTWSFFSDDPGDLVRLKRLANITYAAMALYPKELFESSNLKSIYLSKDLHVGPQLRKAMPAPESDALVFSENNDLVCLPGMEARIHHEYFHFLEAKATGSMRTQHSDWNASNGSGFSYGDGGQVTYHCEVGFRNTGHVKPGFVSRYALAAHEEDRAETFAWMMTRGFATKLESYTQNDEVLRKKRESIMRFMSSKFSKEMDADYFKTFLQE